MRRSLWRFREKRKQRVRKRLLRSRKHKNGRALLAVFYIAWRF